MYEVHVLFEGYSTQIDEVTMDANCSCTLIKGPNKNVIVDTMTAWDTQDIVDGKKSSCKSFSILGISLVTHVLTSNSHSHNINIHWLPSPIININ